MQCNINAGKDKHRAERRRYGGGEDAGVGVKEMMMVSAIDAMVGGGGRSSGSVERKKVVRVSAAVAVVVALAVSGSRKLAGDL
ncbi:hypothetical protein Tco_1108677 [Tanacetum coccineum]